MSKFFIFLFFVSVYAEAQTHRGDLRIMFYNVENLFDTYDDPMTNDNEFTMDGAKNWTNYRYEKKLNSIYKTMVAAGGWNPPEIIGLCEIENKKVLQDLIQKTPLHKYPFDIVHFDSPDRRGIDVCCLYNTDKITLINASPIRVVNPEDSTYRTRDILHAQLKTKRGDTMNIFINHWPSRRGGAYRSAKYRNLASNALVHFINENNFNHIVITGDFNDEPTDSSLHNLITNSNARLKNVSTLENSQGGTLKYQGTWNLFDQFVVSTTFFEPDQALFMDQDSYQIVSYPFLLTDDDAHIGNKPFATYVGPVYKGGFSDHLPVFIDVFMKE